MNVTSLIVGQWNIISYCNKECWISCLTYLVLSISLAFYLSERSRGLIVSMKTNEGVL